MIYYWWSIMVGLPAWRFPNLMHVLNCLMPSESQKQLRTQSHQQQEENIATFLRIGLKQFKIWKMHKLLSLDHQADMQWMRCSKMSFSNHRKPFCHNLILVTRSVKITAESHWNKVRFYHHQQLGINVENLTWILSHRKWYQSFKWYDIDSEVAKTYQQRKLR